MNYSREDVCGTFFISLHTPFIFKVFISTVSYTVKVYGPNTEPENFLRMAVRIQGEDGTETELKHLTNKATEGYEMCVMYSAELAGPRSEWGEEDFESCHCTCLE